MMPLSPLLPLKVPTAHTKQCRDIITEIKMHTYRVHALITTHRATEAIGGIKCLKGRDYTTLIEGWFCYSAKQGSVDGHQQVRFG